jgi:hypothetical protein
MNTQELEEGRGEEEAGCGRGEGRSCMDDKWSRKRGEGALLCYE